MHLHTFPPGRVFFSWRLCLCFENFSNYYQETAWLKKALLAWHVSSINSSQRKLLGVVLLFSLLPLFSLIFIKPFRFNPVLEHLWVTEEPWFKPVKRGGKVAAAISAARVYSAHILMWWCVSQRSCPVSEVNQMRQMECFLCRCERVLWIVSLLLGMCEVSNTIMDVYSTLIWKSWLKGVWLHWKGESAAHFGRSLAELLD